MNTKLVFLSASAATIVVILVFLTARRFLRLSNLGPLA